MPAKEAISNDEISADLFWLDGKQVLYIECTHTHLEFLISRINSRAYVYALCRVLEQSFCGPPTRFTLDQELGVASEMFQDLAITNGIQQQLSPTEAHNSIRIVKLFHAPLRRFRQVLPIVPPSLDKNVILQLTINGMNDTLVPDP